jgi:hypothetical protein
MAGCFPATLIPRQVGLKLKKGAICVAPFTVSFFLTLKFRISNQKGVSGHIYDVYICHPLNYLR